MARTTPVHTGFTILSGSGSGPNGNRIQVWAEYRVGEADTPGNRTWLEAYFYAALDPNYTSSTSYYTGLDSTFTVDSQPAAGVTGGSYDFTSPEKVNLLGSFAGYIPHGEDGTKTAALSGSFTTASSYITGGSVSGEVALPAIARAAAVAASAVTLGESCRVSWTPALSRHSFLLTFSLGDWQFTPDRLYPNTTGQYTYTGLTLPLEVATRFAAATAPMTVQLTTYDGDTVLGTSTADFSVTLPETAETKPVVSATLTPDCPAFPNLFVQRLGKVSAAVTAEDPLGAAITGYTITVGSTVTEGTLSGPLEKAGMVSVTVTAVNSRGFSGSVTKKIMVLPYDSPRLLASAAFRCLADGTSDPGGTSLRITATWEHSSLLDKNSCTLQWRCQPEGGQFGAWQPLPGASPLDTGALPGITLEKDRSYTLELQAVDTAGGRATAVFAIPWEQVYMHRTQNAMGLGGYAQGQGVLDVHWDLHARRDIACHGAVNGVYVRTVTLRGTKTLRLQTKWPYFTAGTGARQSVFLFGCANGVLIQGVLGVSDTGGVKWEGTSGVTAAAESETGIVTLTLPAAAYDRFVLLSADDISAE